METVHGICIVRRVFLELEVRRICIMVGKQRAAIIGETYSTQVRHENQAMAAQVQITMDGLAHHAADIRATRVEPSFM